MPWGKVCLWVFAENMCMCILHYNRQKQIHVGQFGLLDEQMPWGKVFLWVSAENMLAEILHYNRQKQIHVSQFGLEKQMPWAKVCVQVWICYGNHLNRTAGFYFSKCNIKSNAGP